MDRLVGLCDDVKRKKNKAAITIESKACNVEGAESRERSHHVLR